MGMHVQAQRITLVCVQQLSAQAHQILKLGPGSPIAAEFKSSEHLALCICSQAHGMTASAEGKRRSSLAASLGPT